MTASDSSSAPDVLLSAFADEAANHKTALEQFAALAALGLKWYSPRFVAVDRGDEVSHVVDLPDEKLARLRELQDEFGLSATSIGSRVAKVKLRDADDGSHNAFVPDDEYLAGEVANTIRAAQALGAKIVRGFSFYHPSGEPPEGYVAEAAERLRPIVARCAEAGLIYALEVEANLVGQNGEMMAALFEALGENGGAESVVCIFDGGNLSSQNMTPDQCYAQWQAMAPVTGYLHIKDYQIDPNLKWEGVVDEERLKNFVPADVGDSAHDRIFADLAAHLPMMRSRMTSLGAAGVYLELEPHLKGGGQFGGFSGPDGMGVAVRAVCRMLDEAGLTYDLRTMDDIRAARGF